MTKPQFVLQTLAALVVILLLPVLLLKGDRK